MDPVMESKVVDPIDALLEQVHARPQAVAMELLPSGQRLTYADLLRLAQRYKARFAREGVCAGDAVLLMLGAGPDIVAALLALLSLSALAVPVNPGLTDFELEPVLRDSRPVGVLTTSGIARRALLSDALCLRFRITPAELVQGEELALSAPAGNPLATCHFTYKGLGIPLGALHRYGDYGVALDAMLDRYGHTARSTHLCVLPMYPVYGLTVSTMLPLAMGCRLLLAQNLKELDLLRVLREEQVRMSGFVPLIYRSLLELAEAERAQGKELGLHPELEIISGGNHLSRELYEQGRELLGFSPYQGYGLTETLPFTTNHRKDHRDGTLGPGFRSDFRVQVVNARGHAVEPGRVGEVVLSGPTVSEGYLGRPRETEHFLRAGRFFTGDLGHIDGQGHLCFDGRALPFTKPAAHMVDLTEIENVLRLHPAVVNAIATVECHPQSGERVSASVIVPRTSEVDASVLRRHCQTYLSAHKIPRSFELYHGDAASFSKHSA
jgi:long-chain acyl-CoA synthetase